MLSIIKLQNGTEVVGDVCEQTNTHLTLKDPLQINYRLVTSQPMPIVSVSRYMPFVKDDKFVFDKSQIMHISEPREAMCSYYSNALRNYKSVVEKVVDKELLSAANLYDVNTNARAPELTADDDLTDMQAAIIERLSFKGQLN